MASKQLTIEQALNCAKCGTTATFVEDCHHPSYEAGEVALIACPNFFCKEKPWFHCKSCKKRCYRNVLVKHATTNRHVLQHASEYPAPVATKVANPDPTPMTDPCTPTDFAFPDFPMETNTEDADDLDFVTMDTEQFHEQMNKELSKTHIDNATSSMDVPTKIGPSSTPSQFPKISMRGNEWLEEVMADTPIATVHQMFDVFSGPELEKMKNFWVAEQASGDGHCGGGLPYVAARAFQQVRDSQLDLNRIPDYDEAVWQFRNLVQHHSMNEKQQRRQSQLNMALARHLPADTFLKHTFIPLNHQLGRYYGITGQHSMWNNLPAPKAVEVDGVAYVSPKAIITFVMANGIPIDDIFLREQGGPIVQPDKVHHVSQSNKAVNWINSIRADYYGSDSGAPNSKNGAPKFPVVICCSLSDWCDGFGPSRTKNNRNSVDLKSFTVSPPKHLVNATNNTFPVAMGLKKARGWTQVENMFRKELEELTTSKKPILLYNGVLQKVVPYFFRRFVVMSDKAERNGLTGTLGCGSNLHKCFGVSGNIQTPSCNVDEIERCLNQERKNSKALPFGWSGNYVQQNVNGAIFPACYNCRKMSLQKLGVTFGLDNVNISDCKACSNWNLLPENVSVSLDFPAHKDYPKSIAEGSPVPPPRGRDVFEEGISLPFIQIEWDVMKAACKFAFYQASRPKKAWSKGTTTCYLKHCGISNELAERLYDAAKACSKGKQQDTINYSQAEGVGTFEFPASWLSREISVRDYIEAVMHQLFLGIASSNFDIIQRWMAESPSSSKIGLSPFKSTLQNLIKDLRPFMLSWLAAYPLTGKKGNLGTGSWVAENYICFVRISQFVFGWCIRDASCSGNGVEDMSRMVISFHSLVAHLLTHSGIDSKHISKTKLLMKEFLSATREFDIRVRHKALKSAPSKASEAKSSEAWWLKSNYMSLVNLILAMILLGPLVEYWDGGGKGERFIQVVKPHIKRGVREDTQNLFFVNLLDKIFRILELNILEGRYGVDGDGKNCNQDDDHLTTMLELLIEEVVDVLTPPDGDSAADTAEITSSESDSANDTTTDGAENEDDDEGGASEEACFSASEIRGMTKKKIFYVYRNEHQLNHAIAVKKPLSGIVEVSRVNGKTAFEFKLIYRKPVKSFAQKHVSFDDDNGMYFHGMWCSEVTVRNAEAPPTKSFADIQLAAKLAAVAIPLWYLLGKNHADANKYCVITNWWKYRMKDGWYRLPTIDPSLYGGELDESIGEYDDEDEDEDEDTKGNIRIVNGFETAAL